MAPSISSYRKSFFRLVIPPAPLRIRGTRFGISFLFLISKPHFRLRRLDAFMGVKLPGKRFISGQPCRAF